MFFYGRPLSVSGRPCYICQCFIYLFIYLWPPYSPALVNGGSRKFYTWRTLSVIREVTTWIFSWSSLNYRVGQKVTNFGVFSDPTRKLSALTPESGRILQFWKKIVKHRWSNATFGELWPTNPWDPRATKLLKNERVNSLRHVLFPFAICQHDHARTPYDTVIVCSMLCPNPLTPWPLNLDPLTPTP